jgi:hypothetical protein
MDRAEARHSPIGARVLVLAFIVVAIFDVLVRFLPIDMNDATIGSAVVVGCFSAQVGLLAVWLVLGVARSYWRVASTLAIGGVVWNAVRAWPSPDPFLEVYTAQWFMVAVPLAVVRLAGFRPLRATDSESGAAGARQYSLRDLVVFVTLASVIAAMAVRGGPSAALLLSDVAFSIVVGGLFAGITLATLVATLATRNPVLPTLLSVFGAIGIGAWMWQDTRRGLVDAAVFFLLFAVPVFIQIAALIVCRWQGLRLRRMARPAAGEPVKIETEPQSGSCP